MARFHKPNPLDLHFFALSAASKRLGLPGAFVQIHLDLTSQLDLDGFKRALRGLYRVYPAMAGRLEHAPLTGRPRWRLGGPAPDLDRVVAVHTLTPPTDEELHRQIERLLRCPIDLDTLPPLQFHLFRGRPSGDLLVVRWPHTFMDGRGGVTAIEDIQAHYEHPADLETLTSAGDELRDDFGRLFAQVPWRKRILLRPRDFGDEARRSGPTVFLPRGPIHPDLGPLRCIVRTLGLDDLQRAKDAAMRVCGFARFGGFLRACGVRALHRVMPRPIPAGSTYSTVNVIDYRKRRESSPVCHNFVAMLPIHVPVEVASDRRAVADLFRDQTAAALRAGILQRRLAQFQAMARVPRWAMVRYMCRVESACERANGRGDLADSLSLAMGMIGSFRRPMPTFCGARVAGVLGTHPISPRHGFALAVNEAQGKLNICAMHYESRVDTATIGTLLDELVAGLLDQI